MVSLIALLSSGKGTWAQVNSLIANGSWDRIYLICNEFAHENYETKSQKVIKLKFDEKNPVKSFEVLAKFFKKDIKDFEVALNLVSGSGIEHMAVLSAVLKAGLGVRFVYEYGKEIHEFDIMPGSFEEDDGF